MENKKINDSVKVTVKSMNPYNHSYNGLDKINLLIGNLINVNILIKGMNEIFIWYKIIDSDVYIIGNNNTRQDSIENNDILEGIFCCLQSCKNDVYKAKQEILKLLLW